MSRHYNLLVVKDAPSMPLRNKLLLCNSDYIVRIDDLVSVNNELYQVIDRIQWPQISDEMITFLSENIGIYGEIDAIFHKSFYKEAEDKIEEDAE